MPPPSENLPGASAPATVEPGERPGTWVVRLDGMDQSCMDLGDPTRLDFDYVRRIGGLLDAAAAPGEPLRVLHVGGAGMTLARYVAATRPGSRQVVLEPDVALVDLVRERMPLPRRSGISVRPQDGRAGLAGVHDGWAQAVVVDAFAGAQVPPELVTLEAWQQVARVRAPGGLVVLNLSDRAPFAWARRVVAGAQAGLGEAGGVETGAKRIAVGLEVATLRGRRAGNLLLVCPAAPLPAAGDPAYRWLDSEAVSSSLGGGAPLRDP
ncbi:MAG: fused MFS/spermidine synthase [Nocardioides sp.]|nr:fused MFS/spermidine synthase [Nocardioides sp.]